MPRNDWRAEMSRARSFAAPLGAAAPGAPIPPAGLPPARIVDVPGRGEMFVRESPGQPGAPTILLLHGWTATADLNWFRTYADLAPLGRVLAIDHRGHGRGIRSTERFSLEDAADDAAALLAHLSAEPAVAVGYSMGGPIAMLLWYRHPELVRGLVFEATALEWRATASERLVWKAMVIIEFMLRLGRPKSMVERALRNAVAAAPDLGPLLDWLKSELRRADPEMLADAGRALGNYDARGFAGSVDVPAAVVLTTDDRLVKPRKQRQLARALRDVRTFELAADHDACLVSVEAFGRVTAAAVADVIQRGSGRAQRPAGLDDNATRVAGWGA